MGLGCGGMLLVAHSLKLWSIIYPDALILIV
jgi:hypothetical protein